MDSMKEITLNLAKTLLENKIHIIESKEIIKDKSKKLGEGSFGKVYKGYYGDKEVAIKRLKLQQIVSIKEIMQEIKAVSRLAPNPRVPKFYGVWNTEKYLHLIFEYINGVDLKQWFRTEKPNDKLKLDIIIQLVSVIEEMHSQNVIHRDLKPENILIMNNTVYVIDFGVSKISSHTQTGTNNQKGTVAYYPPENCCIDTQIDAQNIIKISQKFDIWSIGCITSFIFSGQPPWSKLRKSISHKDKENTDNGLKEVYEKKESIEEKKNEKKVEIKDYKVSEDLKIIFSLTKKQRFPIPENIPQQLKMILLMCFEYNPLERIYAADLKNKLLDYYKSF